ncbi:MAG TPA: Npt1/Npt2 family nucleotide transporter, partial [Terriglobia bacterium]|nr:Npt1/Npt2 family nucleotide transporter [Terriglobia bacterium]
MPWTDNHQKRKTALEGLLSICAPVHREEALTAFLMMMNVFILLTAYYIIKPVREALILSGPGAEVKSYAGAGQAILFWLLLPFYSAFAGRVNRVRLLNGVTAFFISNLLIFYLLGRIGVQLGVVFFLWVGLFNLMMVAQFWALATDIYSQEQGRRLFAVVGVGGSLGAIFGSEVAHRLFKPLGPYSMMLLAAGVLSICIILTTWIHYRESDHDPQREQLAASAIGSSGGFHLVLKDRYLFLIAILILLANLVSTTGEFILGKMVAEQLKTPVAVGQFYAEFFFRVNIVGVALQVFGVSRILKYLGIGPALFFLPLIALCSYGAMVFVPVLQFIRFIKIAENSTDYSIQNTARHALFLRTSREAKYKAKAAIDSFFWRAGDAFSGLLVFIGTRLAFGLRSFAMVNAIFV